MSVGRVARRYARAAFDIAVERGELDGWLADLRKLQSIFENPELARLLESPDLQFSQKEAIVSDATMRIDPLRRNLALLLVQNSRGSLIGEIVEEFVRLSNEFRGLVVAEITTAVPLDDAETRVITRQLETLTGRQIILHKQVDPSIIGGVVARIGDRLIDGSVVGRLAALRESLTR